MIDESLIIGIQWRDSAGNEHFSVSDYIDIVSHPGYVIFNWDINEEITRNSGPISFSVRIYRLDENRNVEYSFSTLTATSFISSALNYDATALLEGESMNSLVIGRLTNSPAPSGTGSAEAPIIITNLPSYQDLATVTGERQLAVQAYSPDGGRISYVWQYKGLNSGDYSNFSGSNNNKNYIQTTDEVFMEDNTYYVKTGTVNGVDAYRAINPQSTTEGYDIGDSIAEWIAGQEEITALYELYATAVVTTTGYYQALVTNRHDGATNTIVAGPCIIPGPATFSVASPDAPTNNFLDTSGRKVLVVNCTSNSEYEPKDQFKITWKDKVTGDDSTETQVGVVQQVTEASTITAGGAEGVPSEARALYDHTFSASIVATRNGDDSVVPEVKTFRVTADPEQYPPQLALTSENVTLESNTDIKTVTVSVTNVDNINSDGYTYQWYKDLGTTNAHVVDDVDIALPGETSATIQFSETNSNIGQGGIGNWYFCAVTNTLNGKNKTVYSNSVYLGKSY